VAAGNAVDLEFDDFFAASYRAVVRGAAFVVGDWEVAREIAQEAFVKAPRMQRAAIALHYLDDLPVNQVALTIGCAEATARVHLHRGRQRLASCCGNRWSIKRKLKRTRRSTMPPDDYVGWIVSTTASPAIDLDADLQAVHRRASVRRRARRRSLGAVALLGAVTVLVGAFALGDSHADDRSRVIVQPSTTESSVTTTLVPPDAKRIAPGDVTEFAGIHGNGPLAVGAGSVWVADGDTASCTDSRSCSWLLRIDPESGEVVARVQLSKQALGLAVDGSGVWAMTDVPDGSPAVVTHVDPATNTVVSDTDIPGTSVLGNSGSPPGVALGAGSVWAYYGRTLARIEPATGKVVATIDLPNAPDHGITSGQGMVANDRGVWLNGSSAIWHVDPSTNAVSTLVALQPGYVQSMALDGGTLWVTQTRTNADGGPEPAQLFRVDTRTGEVRATRVRTCHVATGSGQVWFQRICTPTLSTSRPEVLAQVDPETGQVLRYANVPAELLDPPTVAVAPDAVWLLDRTRLTRVRTAH
jgi:hypothetical protein